MNKKYYKWLLMLTLSFFLGSCGLFSNQETLEPDRKPSTEDIEEVPEDSNHQNQIEEEINQDVTAWMPRLDNVLYAYEGVGNEYATFNWRPQFNQENYYQTATNNGSTVTVEIFEYNDNEIVRTFQRPETYFRDNFTETGSFLEDSEEEVILKAPIEVGNKWSSNGNEYEITAVNHEMIVPAGNYNTIEVTITMPDMTVKKYYAEDIGLISEVSETEKLTVESKLEIIKTNTPEVLPFVVYLPDEQAIGMDSVETELILNTNDSARVAIEELLSGKSERYKDINILSEGTKINYLFLNDEYIIEVDLSSEFEENMAGSTGEMFGIYTFVNTLSEYYRTKEILLTVEGKSYNGPHFTLKEGELLTFNEDMVN